MRLNRALLISNGLIATEVVLVGGPPVDVVTVPLRGGVTLLYGANGAGKTTILDGVGAALYGVKREEGEAVLVCELHADNSGFDSQLLVEIADLGAEPGTSGFDDVDEALDVIRYHDTNDITATWSQEQHVAVVEWLAESLAALAEVDAASVRLSLVAAGSPSAPAWDVYVATVVPVPADVELVRTGGVLPLMPPARRGAAWDLIAGSVAGRSHVAVRKQLLGRVQGGEMLRCARAGENFDIEQATLAFVRARYRDDEAGDPWENAELHGDRLTSTATTFFSQLTGMEWVVRYRVNRPEDWIEDGLGRWEVDDGSGMWVPAVRLGSGWRRWAALAIRFALSDVETPAVVLIDEPEAGLHPLAVSSITAAFGDFDSVAFLPSRSPVFEEQLGCIVATTHHPAVLGAADAHLLHVTKDVQGRSMIAPLDTSGEPTAVAATLGCSVAEVLLMTRVFVLVEGVHDQAVIETVFRDELAEARARVVVMGGASNVGHHINAEFFARYTSARLVVVLDRLGSAAGELWKRVVDAARQGDRDAAHRALNELSRRDGREADWLGDAGRTALDSGNIERIAVVGLNQPDIIRYLPVTEFVPSARSWDELGRPTGGQDYKQWLRTQHGAKIDVDSVRAATAKLDDLADLPQILNAIR